MKRFLTWRRVAMAVAGGGILLQSGSCALNAESLAYSLLTSLLEALLSSLTSATA